MKEHAIPQDITGYKFHIVGNMTLKQFAEVGLGAFFGFLIFKTNLAMFIKWPLIAAVVGLGAAAAFVPFEERPLDHWLITFVKTLYKPTKFFWKQSQQIPEAFTFKPRDNQKALVSEVDLTPARRKRITEYLRSIRVGESYDWDSHEKEEANKILNIFSDQSLKIIPSSNTTLKKPRLKIRVRTLKQINLPPETEVVVTNTATHNVVLSTREALQAHQVAQNISIPNAKSIEIEPSEQQPATQSQTTQKQVYSSAQSTLTTSDKPSSAASHNSNLPFPIKPIKPNKLVGMTLSKSGDLVNNALVEIFNQSGKAVTAIKSNALGQFFISTPLKNGLYNIVVKKDPLVFNPVQISLTGQVVEPLDIRSNN